MTANEPTLEDFGKLLVEEIRDAVIKHFDLLATRHFVASCWTPLQDAVATLNDEQQNIVRQCITTGIDAALDGFLQALQISNCSVSVNGKELADLHPDLVERMFAQNGWVQRFSKYASGGS